MGRLANYLMELVDYCVFILFLNRDEQELGGLKGPAVRDEESHDAKRN